MNLADSEGVGSIFIWSFVLIVILLVGFYGVVWIRNWTKEEEDAAPIGIGFTLDDLRELRRSGKMTDDEFEKARVKIVQGTQKEAEKIAAAAVAPKDPVEVMRQRAQAHRDRQQNPPQSDKPTP